MRTAVLFGSTGLVGGHVLNELLAHAEFDRVVAIGRRAVGREHEKLAELTVDFERLSDAALVDSLRDVARGDVHDVFACLGTTIKVAGSKERFRRVDHDYSVAGVALAKRAGARYAALVSSVGADPSSANFYLSVKGETERDVEAAGPWETLAILRPSLLLGDRREVRAGERIGAMFARPLGPLMRGPLEAYRPIEAADVARAMVAALLEGASGSHVHTFRDIARLAAKA